MEVDCCLLVADDSAGFGENEHVSHLMLGLRSLVQKEYSIKMYQ